MRGGPKQDGSASTGRDRKTQTGRIRRDVRLIH